LQPRAAVDSKLLTPVCSTPLAKRSHPSCSCRFVRHNHIVRPTPGIVQTRTLIKTAGVFDSSPATTTTDTEKWWQKNKDLWIEVKTTQDFDREVLGADRPVAVEWFASWCHGCQKAYPEICKIVQDSELRKSFKFVKICVDDMQAFARAQGITALPRMSVYQPGEGLLVTIDVPASRVKHLKMNLNVIKMNPGQAFTLDPNGFVVAVGKSQAAKAKEDKAKAIEELSANKGGLFEHLMKVAKGGAATAPPASPVGTSISSGSDSDEGQATSTTTRSPSPVSVASVSSSDSLGWPASLNLGAMYNLDKAGFMQRYRNEYGYGGAIEALYPAEVGVRMKPREHYMDYTGSGVYCQSQLDAVFQELRTNMFGNPHSANPSSTATSNSVEDVRLQLLRYFNADPAEYLVVFTRSATGALKMVGETFPWSKDSQFRYLRENHNSVLGIREYALQHGGAFQAVDERYVEEWVHGTGGHDHVPSSGSEDVTYSLFAFPAEDNFAGVKYPLSWVRDIQKRSTDKHKWMVLVDAAAYVPTQPLDLSATPADFVDVAFYKMFGYPTGLGALIVKVDAVPLLRKVFWGGGTVALATSRENFHVLKCKPSDKLEDGTVAFLDIIALKHGFAMIQKLGGINKIQQHVGALTEWTYERLSNLRHTNGQPMLAIFGKHNHPNRRQVQGAIINFEILKPDGNVFSYKTFEREAAVEGFHVRTGSECNPGACYTYLGVEETEVEDLAGKKEGCDDDVEFIEVERPAGDNKVIHSSELLRSIMNSAVNLGHPAEVAMKWVQVPLGSVRVSLGHMSTFEDCWCLVDFISHKYRDRME